MPDGHLTPPVPATALRRAEGHLAPGSARADEHGSIGLTTDLTRGVFGVRTRGLPFCMRHFLDARSTSTTAHGFSAGHVDDRAGGDTGGIASHPDQAHPGLRLRRKAALDGAPPHPPVGGPPLYGA